MAQPPVYVPGSFSDESFDATVLALLDTEFAGIRAVLDAVRTNLAAIQRDDTLLANSAVHRQAISPEVLALFLSAWNPRGTWATTTEYARLDVVSQSGETWLCVQAHTSGTFSTDQGNGLWLAISSTAANNLGLLSVTSADTSTAYTVTTGSSYGSWNDVPPMLVDWHTDCGDDATINVDGLGAKNLKIEGSNVEASDLSGQDVIVYDAGDDAVLVVARDKSTSVIQPSVQSAITSNKTLTNAELTSVSHFLQPADISSGSGTTVVLTLPAAAAGNANKLVTLQVSADAGAGSSNKAQVNDSGGTEIYTGVKTGDFVTLYSDGSTWRVLDHRETFYAKVYVDTDESIASGASEQLVNLSVTEHWGNFWDGAGDEADLPFDCWIDLNMVLMASGADEAALVAEAKLNTTYLRDGSGIGTVESPEHYAPVLSGRFKGASGQALELWARNVESDAANTAMGDAAGDESFATIHLTRIY